MPFEFVSEGCEDLTAYTSEELTDLGLADIIAPGDMQKIERLYASTLALGLPLEVSFGILTKTGEKKRVLSRSRIVQTDDAGMPSVFEGLLVDVTRLIKSEVTSVENRDNSDLWEKIGYGIRSPMNAILGLSEIGLRSDMPKEVRKYTQIIGEAGQKLMRAINDIMDYKKIKSGELELVSRRYDFLALIEDAAQFVDENFDLEFRLHVDKDLPRVLIGDEERMRQILLHLLSNAVIFTDIGYVSLSVEGKTFDDSVELTMVVEDTGHGIKEEDKENIFEPFTQCDNSTIEGSGLGLTLVKALAEQMGGNISVTSAYGAGSIFTVSLKQGVCDDETLPDVKKSRRVFKKPGFIAPDARVLVVDDVSANLTVAEGFLRPYKMQVDLCTSGEAAIAAVQTKSYDLILMDCLMPGMSGVRAAELIHTVPGYENIPVIAQTANTSEHSMNGYLAKPINAAALNELLETWIPAEKRREIPPNEPSPLSNTNLSSLEIPGINVQKGIEKMAGNAEIYMRVLKEYCNGGSGLAKNLQICTESGDLNTYHIYAHALNSISENIGAHEISAEASSLEKAAERGDFSFVAGNTSAFVDKLLKLLSNIKHAVKDIEIAPPPAKSASKNTDKRKVLLIDDTPSYLLFLSDILKDDFEPLTSINAQDGIQTARATMPDLILLDLMMPGMSGYEALEILKSDSDLKHIPVILISGKEQKENEAKGISLGAVGYVKKPFEPHTVKTKVWNVLRSAAGED